ncbi:MAG: redoxin domain-containing protein, partial [Desulfovibrionaceae bacterium]
MRRPWSGGAFVSRLGSRLASVLALLFLMAGLAAGAAASGGESRGVPPEDIYQPRDLVPVDSATPLRVGDVAPDFDLPGIVPGSEPGIDGGRVRLSDYRGRKNVLVSFVPAAWTPVCSDQWPGYNLARELFEAHDTVVLGVSVDN